MASDGIILGENFVGEVERVGDDVLEFQKGDVVREPDGLRWL